MTIQEIKKHLDKIEKIDKPDDYKLTNQLTEEISKFGILVFDDGNPYMKCDSYYQRLTDEEGKIVLQQLLSPSAQLRVPSAVITECYKRLSHSTDLQRDIRADFFKTQHLLNLKNGVYDIQKKELLKSDLSYQFDYVLNFSYKENITLENTPAFKSYVKHSIGKENLECLLRSTGYCISSLTKGRKAFLLFGLGKTEKSTWLNLIEEAVGDSFISHEPFHKMTSEQFKAKYIGKRINISCDSSSAPMRHEESFKSLISCEKTTGRNLYENSIDFLPTLKFAFASNEELHFSHPDDAIYDRLVLLPFTKKNTGRKA
ncbi:MAG: DUF5906 domain-containing protein [Ruminococcus sp.]|nr:DUF5906 domain-containing protein [Ruminococcus sp.]